MLDLLFDLLGRITDILLGWIALSVAATIFWTMIRNLNKAFCDDNVWVAGRTRSD